MQNGLQQRISQALIERLILRINVDKVQLSKDEKGIGGHFCVFEKMIDNIAISPPQIYSYDDDHKRHNYAAAGRMLQFTI